MTSEDAARDRLIYDDLVRFCGDLQTSIASTVNRSQTLLSLSVAALIGYFAISGRAVGQASILELAGAGIFLAGTAFFIPIAFIPDLYGNNRLGSSYNRVSLETTTKASVAIMLDLEEQLSELWENRWDRYTTAIAAWLTSLLAGIAMIALGRLL